MDRQSLLEQKRQRLQELKQRRLGTNSNDEAKVDQLIQKLSEPSKVGISIGVQVDYIDQSTASIPSNAFQTSTISRPEKENLTYDKAVQTVSIVEESVVIKDTPKVEAEKESPVPIEEHVDEEELNKAVQESIKLVHSMKFKEIASKQVDYTKNIDQKSTATNQHNWNIRPLGGGTQIEQIKNRAVCCVDFSPHFPELMVVAYSSSSVRNSTPGLAVIYSWKEDKEYPEFFLNCTASITAIKFDQVTSTKIIGGLSDGKLVIWSLENNTSNIVPILPLLTTPIFSLSGSKITKSSDVDFKHHTSAITSISQLNIDGNDSIISFSLDGTINTWSTNLLASPSSDSVLLIKSKPSNEFTNLKENLRVLKAVFLNSGERTTSHINSNVSGSHSFLEDVIIASDGGLLASLTSQESQDFIKTTYQESSPENDTFSLFPNSITDLQKLFFGNKGPYLITSNVDWTFKIWSPTVKQPLLSIPTNSLILKIAIRPNHNSQFVTLSLMNNSSPKKSALEFWDLETKLFKSILEVPIPETKGLITAISFNQDGTRLLAGFDNGITLHWPIDDESLPLMNLHPESRLDEGISQYL